MTFLPITSTTPAWSDGWQSARDAIVPFIGERAAALFGYAISQSFGCENCAAHLRADLVAAGEDPDRPQVTETEQLLIDWGRLIATAPRDIAPEFYARLEIAFNPQLRVLLLDFAGQMVATAVVTTVGRIGQ